MKEREGKAISEGKRGEDKRSLRAREERTSDL